MTNERIEKAREWWERWQYEHGLIVHERFVDHAKLLARYRLEGKIEVLEQIAEDVPCECTSHDREPGQVSECPNEIINERIAALKEERDR